VRAVSSERRPGNPRGKRGGRGRAVRPQPDSLAAFVRGTDRSRLLEHADEILLCKRVQLLRKVEATRAMMLRKAAETATQAAAERLQPAGGVWDGGGSAATSAAHVLGEGETVASVSFPEWAAAEGMTEAELRAIIADGREAEAAIIGANIGLVKSAIAAMKRTSGGRIDQGTTEQDLMQEGSLSLVKAAEKFDVTLGLRFSTYATYWIRNALTMTIRDTTRTIRLPQRLQNTYSKISRATEELRANSNWEPTDEEVAERVGGITPAKVREIRNTMQSRATSLDSLLGEDKTLGDFIPDEKQRGEADIVQDMMQRDLRRLMKQHLSAEEVQVLSLRFGLDDIGESRSLRAVSEEMGISYSRVKNVLFAALTKLRRPHVAIALRDYISGDSDGTEFSL